MTDSNKMTNTIIKDEKICTIETEKQYNELIKERKYNN